jgi:hypothetical protein
MSLCFITYNVIQVYEEEDVSYKDYWMGAVSFTFQPLYSRTRSLRQTQDRRMVEFHSDSNSLGAEKVS